MPDFETLNVSLDNHIATVRLNRPDKANAVNATMWQDIRRAFSPADMKLVADQVVARCDALDLLADGIVGDIKRCQSAFKLAELQCTGAKTDQCLSATQVAALQRSFDGPRNSKGEPLYSDWSFDGGIGAGGWRTWKLESSIPPWDRNPIIATMGAGSLAYIFTTPPTQVPGTPTARPEMLVLPVSSVTETNRR